MPSNEPQTPGMSKTPGTTPATTPAQHCVEAAQCCEQVGLALRTRQTFAAELEPGGIEPELEAVAEADERVARQTFAALHALEQEARPERLELQVGRHRGVEVGGDVEQVGRHLRFLCREDPGTHNKKPIPGGSRRWVLDSCVLDARARARS